MPIHFYIVILLFFGIGITLYKRNESNQKQVNIIFLVLLSIITLISALRYGMGTDFYAYRWHFNATPEWSSFFSYATHMDIGFNFLLYIFKNLNLSYEMFIGFLSITMFGLSGYTIYKNSSFKIFSLFILFSAGYFEVYFNSGLRQGLAMTIFFFAYYQLLTKGKILHYIGAIIVATLFHKAALFAIIIPIIQYLANTKFNNKKINISLFILAFIFLGLGGFEIIGYLFSLVGVTLNYGVSGVSIMAVLLRLLLLTIMLALYYPNQEKFREIEKTQIYIYFIMTVLFISFSNNMSLSRLTDFIMIIEIIILPNLLIKSLNKCLITKGIFMLVIAVYSVTLLKDMNASLNQGLYYNKNIGDYPYVTSIEEDHHEKSLEYRDVNNEAYRK